MDKKLGFESILDLGSVDNTSQETSDSELYCPDCYDCDGGNCEECDHEN